MVKVTATSTFAGDPAVVAANAFDGRHGHRVVLLAAGRCSWAAALLAEAAGDHGASPPILGQDQPGVLPGTARGRPADPRGRASAGGHDRDPGPAS